MVSSKHRRASGKPESKLATTSFLSTADTTTATESAVVQSLPAARVPVDSVIVVPLTDLYEELTSGAIQPLGINHLGIAFGIEIVEHRRFFVSHAFVKSTRG